MNRMLSMYCDHVTCSAGRKRRRKSSAALPVSLLLCALALAVFSQ